MHFDLLFEKIEQHHGAVVKTIGDAVMASFTQPQQAVRAALAAQAAFKEFRPLHPESEEVIFVKMGIHHGSCIAVTLNDRLDFFGGTVNIAARAQQQASGGDILITEPVHADASVQDLIKAMIVTPMQAKLKGLSHLYTLYRITDA
jgi:class 3 adenylate cyclase